MLGPFKLGTHQQSHEDYGSPRSRPLSGHSPLHAVRIGWLFLKDHAPVGAYGVVLPFIQK